MTIAPPSAAPPGRLAGRTAFVTGGGSGLGRALVRRFVAEGARVAAVDRDLDAVRETIAGLDPDTVVAVAADVRSDADLHAAVDQVTARFGDIDTVVPNAGIWDYNRTFTDVDAPTLSAVFDEVMAVNARGYLLTVEATWRHLVRQRGSVTMTLSNASIHPNGGGPAYTASKHAALGLVRELAYELAPRVRVNGVAVGGMRTGLRGPAAADLDRTSIGDSFVRPEDNGRRPHVPLHEGSIDPEAFVGAYVYLAAPQESSTVTGAVIPADGGIAVRGFRSASGGDHLLGLVDA